MSETETIFPRLSLCTIFTAEKEWQVENFELLLRCIKEHSQVEWIIFNNGFKKIHDFLERVVISGEPHITYAWSSKPYSLKQAQNLTFRLTSGGQVLNLFLDMPVEVLSQVLDDYSKNHKITFCEAVSYLNIHNKLKVTFLLSKRACHLSEGRRHPNLKEMLAVIKDKICNKYKKNSGVVTKPHSEVIAGLRTYKTISRYYALAIIFINYIWSVLLQSSKHPINLNGFSDNKRSLQFSIDTGNIDKDINFEILAQNTSCVLLHIAIIPILGLCSRLRAIASALRVCSKTGAQLTIVWDWGSFEALFDIPPNTQILNSTEFDAIAKNFKFLWRGEENSSIGVPRSGCSSIALRSDSLFGFLNEKDLSMQDILPWMLKPKKDILDAVAEFSKNNFSLKMAGIHIRRTDNLRAIQSTPDSFFIAEIEKAINEGFKVFLATDNCATEMEMRKLFSENLIVFQKSKTLEKRWPRKEFDLQQVKDDIIDLYLLISCEYVIGSAESVFSQYAVALNKSPKSCLL